MLTAAGLSETCTRFPFKPSCPEIHTDFILGTLGTTLGAKLVKYDEYSRISPWALLCPVRSLLRGGSSG